MTSDTKQHGQKHYIHFAIMLLLSFVAMFILMYAMVDRFANVYPNLNQFYMAGLMVAPMAVLEILVMGSMYPNKAANMGIMAAGLVVLAVFWFGIRQQVAISDDQFLKSMIPHHAGAILMCQQASLHDAEVKRLCGDIVSSQQKEIDQMEGILHRIER